ncbi:hypothetical protein QR680_009881 [Steinernema hermaphroditum]|uniref:Protein MAK10 homolog n=1 Tax=Steinernema hermaphroditum TaxID=289476 RepID=A0AA39MAQ0_9BILA|nr:hypothetical protein QR680_009881 [Steinernema hermaphroditum]
MIDCHCHLADPQFESDIDEVIARAKNSGVIGAVVCAEFLDQFDQVLNLYDKYPDFAFPALGIHPVQRGHVSAQLDHYVGAENAISREKARLAAIGEVGLDFTPRYIKTDEDKTIQREIFAKQIALARSLDLAVNVHSRSAGRPVIDHLINNGAQKVLLHAFSGSPKNAKPAIDAGFFFSIPPSFTLNKAEKERLISAIPIDQLCLETDSPVLGPSKTERNEPMNIRYSAELIAEVKNISVEEVISKTTANALKLFPMLKKCVNLTTTSAMIRPEAALGNAFEELSIDIQDELADESRTKIDLDSLPRNSVEITAEFASACRELKSGQLVLSAGFGLGEAMAAIEIMEPKMDAGMKKVDLDNLNLEEMVRTKQINVENMPQNEMIATMDCTIAALASWLNGRSADETLFTNILLQDWRCIEDFTLRAFCKGIIQVFKLFSEVITDAGTFYEEDFVVPYYADIYLDTTGCVIDLVREVHRLNRMIDGKEKNELTCIRDRLELVLQFINVVKYFIGFEPTEYGNSLPCASIFSGCTKTDNFRPNFAQAFESAKKGGVLVLLMSTTYKQFGLNPRKDQRKQENGGVDSSYEWLPAFNPDLNRMDVPAVFPRKRNLLSRHEGFKYFTQLFNLLLNIPSHQNALPELNHFLNNVRTYSSWKESCVLSRSFLQMVVRPKEQLVFGRYDMKDIIYQNMRAGVPLKYMVDDKTDSGHRRDVAFLIDTFVAGASECFVSIVKMYGHNKERRREIISTLLNDLEILAEEASRCDTITTAYLMEREEAMDPKEVMEEVIPSLYDFVMNYTFSLIQYHFLLGFELDLFDAHEYPYLFWYTSQITTLWRDVISHRRHQLLDTDEKLNDLLRYSVSDVSNGGKKKKRKDRSPKEHQLTTQENGEATLRKYNLDYMGQQIAKKTVAGDFYVAVIKALIALKETKEFFTPPGERRRFNERVKWFQAVPEVAHLTYDAYSSFVRPVRPSHNDRKQLLSEAAGAFKKFADGELASTMKELAICSKKNWIALNLLADDPTREVVYNFKNGAFDVILLLGVKTRTGL